MFRIDACIRPTIAGTISRLASVTGESRNFSVGDALSVHGLDLVLEILGRRYGDTVDDGHRVPLAGQQRRNLISVADASVHDSLAVRRRGGQGRLQISSGDDACR